MTREKKEVVVRGPGEKGRDPRTPFPNPEKPWIASALSRSSALQKSQVTPEVLKVESGIRAQLWD